MHETTRNFNSALIMAKLPWYLKEISKPESKNGAWTQRIKINWFWAFKMRLIKRFSKRKL